LGTTCWVWLQTTILLISASWVARITGVSHGYPWCFHTRRNMSRLAMSTLTTLIYHVVALLVTSDVLRLCLSLLAFSHAIEHLYCVSVPLLKCKHQESSDAP
jgi:hypothetical protein